MACEEQAETVERLSNRLAELKSEHQDLTGSPELEDATGGTGNAGASGQVNEVRRAIIETTKALRSAREALAACRKAENASGSADIGSGSAEIGSGSQRL